MRSLVGPLLAALLLATAVPAAAAAAPADEVLKVGAPITVKKAVDIAALARRPAKFEGKTVRLEGVVKEVCQGRGCWVEVVGPKGASFMARSLDHSIVLPKDCKGRRIVVEGVVTAMKAAETPEEHAAHAEAEAAEPAGHACPVTEWVVATTGAELQASR